MSANAWDQVIGHDHIRGWFATAIAQSRLGGSFLMVGSPGVGKHAFARAIAQTLLCEDHAATKMDPCGHCEACQQVIAETHPDLIWLRMPNDKTTIPLESLIGPPDARMQSGFCRDIRLHPYRGRRKVAILDDADHLNEEGANCLLKTLEEPPADALVMLIGTSEQRQLPTIRSRCRVIRFASPTGELAVQLLRHQHGIEATDEQILQAVEMAAGDMHVAARLLGEESGSFRQAFVNQLSASNPDPIAINRILDERVKAAGTDAPKKRALLRDAFSIAVQHYRGDMRNAAQVTGVVPTLTLARLDRSLRGLREVDRMANHGSLIACYATDIASGISEDRGGIGS